VKKKKEGEVPATVRSPKLMFTSSLTDRGQGTKKKVVKKKKKPVAGGDSTYDAI
jgi:hypothetical protein